jgi:hypothetical protein
MLHMRRRSSIRTSRAEVEHAPGELPLAQQQPGAAAAAAAAAGAQQQQQQRHYALLFSPNTDTGPEAGNKLARTQAREQALALGAALRCQSRRLFLSPWPRHPLASPARPTRETGPPQAPGKPPKALGLQYKNRVWPAPRGPSQRPLSSHFGSSSYDSSVEDERAYQVLQN